MTQPPPPSGRAAMVDRVLSYMDKPWKAAVVILILVLAGLGWGAWQERDELAVWLKSSEETLKTDDLPDALSTILAQTSVDLATAWRINIPENAVYLITGRARDGKEWTIVPWRLQLLTPDTKAAGILNILSGQPMCVDLPLSDGVLFTRLEDDGMERVCAVPIGRAGLFVVAWKTPPGDRRESVELGFVHEVSVTVLNK